MKEIAAAADLRNVRLFTDLTGDFNQVVIEHEVAMLSDREALMERYATDPLIREKARSYAEYWLTGRRELCRVVQSGVG